MYNRNCHETLLVKRNSHAERCGSTTGPNVKLDIAGGDIAVQTSEKVILDSNDTSDTYFAHDATNNWISYYIDGTEAMRIKKR